MNAIAMHTITAKDAAHVLYLAGYDGGVRPGSFTTKLIEAALLADASNQERLSRGFEGLIAAVQVYQNLPDGVEVLREIAVPAPPQ